MCSMLRDPRRDDHTTCTAVAPDFIFTVRTYGIRSAYEAGRRRAGQDGRFRTQRETAALASS
jgi:hypothetical protein